MKDRSKVTELIKYAGGILAVLLLAALSVLGRCSVLGTVLVAGLILAVLFLERKDTARKYAKYAMVLLFVVSFWIFNDLMVIGKTQIAFSKVSFLNGLLYLSLFLLAFLVIPRFGIALAIPSVLLFVLGIANAVIKGIRRTAISAGDFFSIRTAMTVAGSYSMEFDSDFYLKVLAGVCFLVGILTFCILVMRKHKEDFCFPRKEKIAGGIGSAFVCILFFSGALPNWAGVKADYWTHEVNGFAYNLYLQMEEIRIREPENYDPKELQRELAVYESEEAVINTEYPNVIAIMNESFADYEKVGDLRTNQDVLPVLHSLKENTIKGNLYVSVYGGNTANTEYEFLTGNSMQYFSERVVPYQLYIRENKENLITQMKQLGYSTVFMHPFGAYGWNRPSVYSFLGTEEMSFEEDMDNLRHIRQYATDESQYGIVKSYLEDETREKPLFLFDVTVQNHGGYTGELAGLTSDVSLESGEAYKEASNYLKLVHESDRALGEFLEYLKSYGEPTVVVFFGDHQPALESGFIEGLIGNSDSEMIEEQRQKKYVTPFFLWANYDFPEMEDINMSANYLGAYLIEKLGLPMTGFQKYLLEMKEEYPVINTVGMIDKDGDHISYQELSEKEEKILKKYDTIIYNYMFDGGSLGEFYSLRD